MIKCSELEGSHSGRVQRFTKPPYRKIPRVRIPPPPLNDRSNLENHSWVPPRVLGISHFVMSESRPLRREVRCAYVKMKCARNSDNRFIRKNTFGVGSVRKT